MLEKYHIAGDKMPDHAFSLLILLSIKIPMQTKKKKK